MAASPSPPLVLPPSNASIRNGSPLALAPQTSQGGGARCFRDMPQASSNETIKAYASLSVRISEMSELNNNCYCSEKFESVLSTMPITAQFALS